MPSTPLREIENVFIPLSDGTRLAARIWMPADAETHPVPALLEYLPYRKDDGTAIRDARRQPYFAAHGYAAVRVDMRGSGNADGILFDEYLEQEQDDAIEVIEWITKQPWCDGNVGMHGISWGGFNALQTAARQPEALKALMVIGFTDDRYHDDVHYMGGCVLASQMMQWSAVMFVYNAAPPDPVFVGERWREMWLERMEKTPPYVEEWLRHQRRDDYWKHGSVGEDYDAIRIPVLAVGGWRDSYNNSIPRLLAGLNTPRRGLVGPWAHSFPSVGPPGPTVGFLQETVRWFDTWLKGDDNGTLELPFLRSYIMQSEPPARHYQSLKGYWVSDPSWPSPHVREKLHYLNQTGGAFTLDPAPKREASVPFKGLLSHGFEHITWGSYGAPGSYPGDQRAADGRALSFTSESLDSPLVLLGNPVLDLDFSVDQPLALAAARLCDVAPDGASRMISWGLLNLTHYESHEFPSPLKPGKRYSAAVQLNLLGYEIPAGHRLRVSISPTYARQAWPSPKPVTLTIHTGPGCRIRLPVRTPQPNDSHVDFEPAETAPPLPYKVLRPEKRRQSLTRDQTSDEITFRLEIDAGRVLLPNGMEVDDWSVETHSIREDDPLSMTQRVEARLEYRRGDWGVRIETISTMSASETHFHVENHMKAFEGHELVFNKTWRADIERNLV